MKIHRKKYGLPCIYSCTFWYRGEVYLDAVPPELWLAGDWHEAKSDIKKCMVS